MSRWKSKVFGDTSVNFYGWIFTGLVLIAFSLGCMLWAFEVDREPSAETLMLAAIYFVLLGQFGLQAQSYCARAAKSLESADANARSADYP